MLKAIFAAGAVLAAATSVIKVAMDREGVTVGGAAVTSTTLQLRDAGSGHLLASKDLVESLGGIVEVTIIGGQVSLQPGVRMRRLEGGFEISTHGQRPIEISTVAGSIVVASPATVSLADGTWTVGKEGHLEGTSLRVALSQQIDGTRVAAAGEPPSDTPPQPPAPVKLDIRRVTWNDPFPSAEPTDEHSVQRGGDPSPSGF